MIGPIVVEPSETAVEATVGRDIVFNVGDDPGQWEISSDNEAVVSVESGGERDGATFNPGAKALSVGEATVTLADQKGMDALQVTVTVTESPGVGISGFPLDSAMPRTTGKVAMPSPFHRRVILRRSRRNASSPPVAGW